MFILAVHSYFGIGRELIHPRKGNDNTQRSILKLIKCLHRSRLLDHFFDTHSYVMNHRLWVTKNKSKTCNILFLVHPGTTPGGIYFDPLRWTQVMWQRCIRDFIHSRTLLLTKLIVLSLLLLQRLMLSSSDRMLLSKSLADGNIKVTGNTTAGNYYCPL